MCRTYIEEASDHSSTSRTFVYLSAEDMGRPMIPRRYIETKREAEAGIRQLCGETNVRDVCVRPSKLHIPLSWTSDNYKTTGFIYHPHLRPISSPMAALASLSATVHKNAPSFVPTPSRILRSLSPSSASEEIPHSLHSLADTLELAPIHLDHVGAGICEAIESKDVRGVVSVENLRDLALTKSHEPRWQQGS